MKKIFKTLIAPALGLACSFSVAAEGDNNEEFLRARLLEMMEPGESKANYFARQVDLNDDGTPEIIAHVAGPMVCGTGGCNTYVFTPEGDDLRLVAEIWLTRPPIKVSSETTNGWKDILVYIAGGGLPSSGYARLKFDGKTYPKNPTVEPAAMLGKNAEGVVVIEPFESFTEGLPLTGYDK